MASAAVDRLMRDHGRLSRVLDLLERQASCDTAESRAWMREGFDYMCRYLDGHHHPAEDAIFKHLARRQPDLAEVVEAVRLEHSAMAGATGNLAALLDEPSAGEGDERATMQRAALNAFVLAQRRHMRFEEGFLFPFIDTGLTAMDSRYLDARLGRLVDPLDTSEGRFRYPRLACILF